MTDYRLIESDKNIRDLNYDLGRIEELFTKMGARVDREWDQHYYKNRWYDTLWSDHHLIISQRGITPFRVWATYRKHYHHKGESKRYAELELEFLYPDDLTEEQRRIQWRQDLKTLRGLDPFLVLMKVLRFDRINILVRERPEYQTAIARDGSGEFRLNPELIEPGMILFHGTSSDRIEFIEKEGLRYTRPGERASWKETSRGEGAVGVYLTSDLAKALVFACEATKDIEEEIDRETARPRPSKIAIVEVRVEDLPRDIMIVPDEIEVELQESPKKVTMFRTDRRDIPAQYLTIRRAREIVSLMGGGMKVRDLAKFCA